MSMKPASSLSVSQLDVPCPAPLRHGYYRSKLFIVTSTTNPILAAASPLFSLLERFAATQSLPSVALIRENIEHEWKAYRSRLATLKYSVEFCSIAEYLLSATIDEVLGKTYLRVEEGPIEFIAFTPSSVDERGPQERLFMIVRYMKERVNQYLDLLELAYYCLISGFEGEYHLRADGRNSLDNLIQELYELIQHNRVHQPVRLFKEYEPAVQVSISRYHPMLWKAALAGLILSVVVYCFCQGMLDYQAKNLYDQQINRVALRH